MGQSSQTSEKKLRTQYASVNVSLETLQQELRLLTGRIEEIEYLLNRKLTDSETAGRKRQERLDEISMTIAETDQRLVILERYLSLDPKAAPAKSDATAAAAPAKTVYETAKSAYDKD